MISKMTDVGASPSDLLEAGQYMGWYPSQRELFLECLSWYYSPSRFLGISAATGCHAKGQGILMYDGSIKKVEDVVVGDQLMGMDSTPREVLSLCQGFGELYRVAPVKGAPFLVNADHVLTLICTNLVGDNSPKRLTHRATNGTHGGLTGGMIRDVSVRDVLKFSKTRKHVSKLFRVGVDFPANHGCALPVSPYVLGLFLGDGSLGGFTSNGDRKCLDLTSARWYPELESEALRFGLVVRMSMRHANDTVFTFRLALPKRRGVERNLFALVLQDLGLLGALSGDKFIPQMYKTASREDRLEILAGLVDTDGYCGHSHQIDFLSKSEKLADDFSFICRSVGLAAYVRPCVKGYEGFAGVYYRVSVSGDCSVIPSRFKRAPVRRQKKSALRTGFTITPAGTGDHYGFTLDGDGRYLLDDFTVTHNSGKSLIALLLAKMTGARTVILTATKGLQDQYCSLAPGTGLTKVVGRNNFPCLLDSNATAEDGVCNLGLVCDLRDECPYRVQLEAARKSNLVITNYAYWLAQTNYTDGLGPAGLLICDEGHLAFEALVGFLTVYISRSEIQPLGVTFPSPGPSQWQGWRLWSASSVDSADHEAQKLSADVRAKRRDRQTLPSALIRAARRATSLVSRLKLLSSLNDEWIVQWTLNGCRFVPKWVAGHSADLFHPTEVPKIVLMSAILSHRTLDYLGVPKDNRTWLEAESQFPPENTPIWHIPTARINYRTGAMDTKVWVSRIDQIIQRRLDRKGIVFTVSYERARLLLSLSRFKDIMLTHSTRDIVQVVEQFKQAPPPVVLVSPSVTTGYDFSQAECGFGKPQYLIVGKVPYPDTSEPVTKARHEDDKDWTSYQAMETLIQECGRASRSVEDKCEVFSVDDSTVWFMRLYGKFAPAWFLRRYMGTRDTVPDPLL